MITCLPNRFAAIISLAPLLLLGVGGAERTTSHSDVATQRNANAPAGEDTAEAHLIVQYLEIVTPEVDQTCDALADIYGVEFMKPLLALGNARIAHLKDGGRIGVRAPMRATEDPVVRPYLLTSNIEQAVKSARQAGAEIAIPPMEIPGQGTFSIYVLGGIEHGLWQL